MSLATALPLLEQALEEIQLELSTSENAEQARKLYAQKLGQAIFDFITAGQVVTNGSATTQTGKIL